MGYFGYGTKRGNLSIEEFAATVTSSTKTRNALTVEATISIIAALLGTSSSASFIESAIGIAIGARTGLAAVVAGMLYFTAVFITPIYNLIPSEATGVHK